MKMIAVHGKAGSTERWKLDFSPYVQWEGSHISSLCEISVSISRSPVTVRIMNDQLMFIERAFIDPLGLPGRKFYRWGMRFLAQLPKALFLKVNLTLTQLNCSSCRLHIGIQLNRLFKVISSGYQTLFITPEENSLAAPVLWCLIPLLGSGTMFLFAIILCDFSLQVCSTTSVTTCSFKAVLSKDWGENQLYWKEGGVKGRRGWEQMCNEDQEKSRREGLERDLWTQDR